MYCKYCGKPLVSEQAPCPYCGITARPSQPPVSDSRIPKEKSSVTAGVLGVLLGAFGAHNFYLGATGKAMAQLLITLLSCGTLAFISAIWGLVEGVGHLIKH